MEAEGAHVLTFFIFRQLCCDNYLLLYLVITWWCSLFSHDNDFFFKFQYKNVNFLIINVLIDFIICT